MYSVSLNTEVILKFRPSFWTSCFFSPNRSIKLSPNGKRGYNQDKCRVHDVLRDAQFTEHHKASDQVNGPFTNHCRSGMSVLLECFLHHGVADIASNQDQDSSKNIGHIADDCFSNICYDLQMENAEAFHDKEDDHDSVNDGTNYLGKGEPAGFPLQKLGELGVQTGGGDQTLDNISGKFCNHTANDNDDQCRHNIGDKTEDDIQHTNGRLRNGLNVQHSQGRDDDWNQNQRVDDISKGVGQLCGILHFYPCFFLQAVHFDLVKHRNQKFPDELGNKEANAQYHNCCQNIRQIAPHGIQKIENGGRDFLHPQALKDSWYKQEENQQIHQLADELNGFLPAFFGCIGFTKQVIQLGFGEQFDDQGLDNFRRDEGEDQEQNGFDDGPGSCA